MSLKSPLDLEAVTRGRDEAMSPRNKSETEMASGSIQAALAALQAGQSSLNQVCKVLAEIDSLYVKCWNGVYFYMLVSLY